MKGMPKNWDDEKFRDQFLKNQASFSPIITPDEFIKNVNEQKYEYARLYVRGCIDDFHKIIYQTLTDINVTLRAFSIKIGVSSPLAFRCIKESISGTSTHGLPIESLVRLASATGLSLHQMIFRREQEISLPRKYTPIIYYLHGLSSDSKIRILDNLNTDTDISREYHHLALSREQEEKLICNRILEFSEENNIPPQKAFNNGVIRSHNETVIIQTENGLSFCGHKLFGLILICLTNAGLSMDYLAKQDYVKYLVPQIYADDTIYKLTGEDMKIISNLSEIPSLEEENKVIGQILAGKYLA